jgi:uncharacterized protein (TIGR02391 family)
MTAPSPQLIRSGTTEEIALVILRDLGEEGATVHAGNYMNGAQQAHQSEFDREKLVGRLSDAWAWLVARGCIGPATSNSGGWERVTRTGGEIAAGDDALAGVWATERLAGELSQPLNLTARPAFSRADYETASFAAMKAVEVEVRRLGGFEDGLIGTKLMQEAFKTNGKLTDGAAEPGEQVATMQLFMGAIGAFKNPASHRTVIFSDPVEAAEVVQLADLLLRILGRVQIRLTQGSA